MRAPGFVEFVRGREGPIPVSDRELANVRQLLESGLPIDPLPGAHLGDYIEIVSGPLSGCQGWLVRKESATIVLTLSAINARVRVKLTNTSGYRVLRRHPPLSRNFHSAAVLNAHA